MRLLATLKQESGVNPITVFSALREEILRLSQNGSAKAELDISW